MASLYIADVTGLRDPAVYRRRTASLPEWKKKELDRCMYQDDRARGAGAFLLLAEVWKNTGHYELLHIKKGAYGKPYIVEDPSFHYNISHAGRYVLLGTASSELGVDIEEIGNIHQSLAERFFSEEERRRIGESENPEREFYRIWTMRESYVKRIGGGLSVDFRSFSLSEGKAAAVESGGKTIKNYFHEVVQIPGYAVSVSLETEETVDLIPVFLLW